MSPAFFYIFPKSKQSKAFKYAIRLLWLVPGFLALGQDAPGHLDRGGHCLRLLVHPQRHRLLALSGVFMKIYRDYESKYISKTKPLSQPLEYVGKD